MGRLFIICFLFCYFKIAYAEYHLNYFKINNSIVDDFYLYNDFYKKIRTQQNLFEEALKIITYTKETEYSRQEIKILSLNENVFELSISSWYLDIEVDKEIIENNFKELSKILDKVIENKQLQTEIVLFFKNLNFKENKIKKIDNFTLEYRSLEVILFFKISGEVFIENGI